MDRYQSGQCHGRELETSPAEESERVQTGAPAAGRLAPGAGRDGGGAQLSANIRDQLQSVLLAKRGRSQYLALSVCRQVGLRRPARSESAARRASIRADC